MALTYKEVERLFQAKPGKKFRLKAHEPDWSANDELKDLSKDELYEKATDAEVQLAPLRRGGKSCGTCPP